MTLDPLGQNPQPAIPGQTTSVPPAAPPAPPAGAPALPVAPALPAPAAQSTPATTANEDTIDLSTLANEAISGKASSRTVSELSKDNCTKVLKAIKGKKGLANVNQSLMLVTGLLQNGGSNRNAGSSVSYTLYGKSLTSAVLLNLIRSEVSTNSIIRQFARGLSTEIAQ